MCGVRIATSSDSLGRPGSWFKWWEGERLDATSTSRHAQFLPCMPCTRCKSMHHPCALETYDSARNIANESACPTESFSQPGLGGREGEVKELGVWGGNPSVTWDSYLQRWLLTWHSWEPFDVMLSSSTDLLHWTPAVRIVVVSCDSC